MADAPRRPPPKKVADIAPPSALANYAPYLVLGALALGLAVVVTRSPAYGVFAGAALVLGVFAGLGWVAYQHILAVPLGDGFRRALAPTTLAVVVPALALAGYTLFPPRPVGTVSLDRVGASAELRVGPSAATVLLDVAGAFKPDVGTDALARYVVSVSRARTEELVEGEFTRRASGGVPATGARGEGSALTADATAGRHTLGTLRGEGGYRIALERVNDTVQLPLRVTLRAEPFAPWMLWTLFGLLGALVLVVDAGLARRGSESAYAAALGVVLAASLHLHAHYTPETLAVDLFAAGLVGVFAGGIGAEVLARITRKILG